MHQTYPAALDYIDAMRHFAELVYDPVLRGGIPRSLDDFSVADGADPMQYSGAFTQVFVVDLDRKTYAVRLWTSDIGDAGERYRAITDYLAKLSLPYFTGFEFIPDGIVIHGSRYPLLRMEWLEAMHLAEFIEAHRDDRAALHAAAAAFLEMVSALHKYQISHGDLQAENIKFITTGGDVVCQLIDYDTVFVPALEGKQLVTTGVPGYQHPSRRATDLASAKDDYFAELVIYLTLRALAVDPELWDFCEMADADKRLLFTSDDFSSAEPTPVFKRLRASRIPIVSNLAVILRNYCRCPDITHLIPLEDAIELAHGGGEPEQESETGAFDEYLKNNFAQSRGARWGEGWLVSDELPPPEPAEVTVVTATTEEVAMAAQPVYVPLPSPAPPPMAPRKGSAGVVIVLALVLIATVAIVWWKLK